MEEMSKVSQTGKTLNGLKGIPGGTGVQKGVGQELQRGSARMTVPRVGGQRSPDCDLPSARQLHTERGSGEREAIIPSAL